MLTLGNLGFGFMVIWLALTKRDMFFEDSARFFTILGALLFVACCCDFLDGFVARKMHVSSALGLELDSLADLVSFGVAPVIVFYVCLFDDRPSFFSFGACLAYLLSGAFRLARFNQSAGQASKPGAYFDGLPITGASLMWVALLLFLGQGLGNSIFEGHETGLRRAMIFLFAALGFLMVSHFPYRSLKAPVKKSSHFKRNAIFLALLAALVMIRFGPAAMLIAIPVLYIFGTPVAAYWKKVHNKEPLLNQRPL